ncbi:MAG: phosphohistidine phosphatase [Acidobacteriota bacterium]|jgi:phosphohistidine phosphatase|nr:phosphohistidine phosphatase [Acidobacteriota bacterium]
MKKLLLLRHAKSSWEDTSLPDFERPLNERGMRAAPLIGKFMREQKIRPDLIICSPAKRARETIALVLEAAGIETELCYDERIYEATVARLVEIISQIEDDKREVLLVGHNPGFENLLEGLTSQTERMPTAALARIILNSENWSDAAAKGGRLERLTKAKELAKH